MTTGQQRGAGSDTATLDITSGDRGQPAAARDFAAAVLDKWGITGEARDDLLLVVSELVTNAIVHGRAPAGLVLHRQGVFVRGEVWDSGGGLPAGWEPIMPDPDTLGDSGDGGFDDAGGRGLPLVARLTGHRVWWEGSHVSFVYGPATAAAA
mgnify:FL=1